MSCPLFCDIPWGKTGFKIQVPPFLALEGLKSCWDGAHLSQQVNWGHFDVGILMSRVSTPCEGQVGEGCTCAVGRRHPGEDGSKPWLWEGFAWHTFRISHGTRSQQENTKDGWMKFSSSPQMDSNATLNQVRRTLGGSSGCRSNCNTRFWGFLGVVVSLWL